MNHPFKSLILVLTIVCLLSASVARALEANFDSLSEGSYGTTLTNGGVTFSQFNDYFGIGSLDVQYAQSNTTLESFFSPPAYLTFDGYAPGEGFGFGRFGSILISFPTIASSTSLDIIGSSAAGVGNTLTLDAYLSNTLVSSVSVIPSSATEWGYALNLSNISFDSLKLISTGPSNGGASFIGLDNVTVNESPVPEPCTWALLLGGLGLLAFRPVRKYWRTAK